jgi:hypothetical protein
MQLGSTQSLEKDGPNQGHIEVARAADGAPRPAGADGSGSPSSASARGKVRHDYEQKQGRKNFLTSIVSFGETPWRRRGGGKGDHHQQAPAALRIRATTTRREREGVEEIGAGGAGTRTRLL